MDEAEQDQADHGGDLPPIVDEDALLADLALVVRACGVERFFTSTILTPTRECFPDSWAPNQAGVRILAQRLMLYAGLDQLEPEVEVFTDPEALAWRKSQQGGRHQGAAAYFMGIQNNKAIFACESGNIGRAEALIATMGHEVAHAFRTYHGVTHSDRRCEEELTDITSVYLGFGVFACNASKTYEKSGTVEGGASVTRESIQRLGYLCPRALAFLFACQMAARGVASRDIRRIRSHLKSDHRQYFMEALHDLQRSRSAVLRELNVTEADADRMVAASTATPRPAPIIIEGIVKQAPVLSAEPAGPICPRCGQAIDYEVKDCPHCRAPITMGCSWFIVVMVATIFISILWPYAFILLFAEVVVYLWKKWRKRKLRISQSSVRPDVEPAARSPQR